MEIFWKAVLDRDTRFDGAFVCAVRTTGIYCRPSCPAKRPRLDHVSFFQLPEAAEQAGYRPCLRCLPDRTAPLGRDGALVRRVCHLIEAHDSPETLTLASLSSQTDISRYHLQRTFKRIMGITPRQYAEARRLSRLKGLVKERNDVTSALYEAGYGSSSRLYERANERLGMTPATYLRGGSGMTIGYTVLDSPLGRLLVAATGRGVCAVSLGEVDADLVEALTQEYPAAEIHRDDVGVGEWAAALVKHLSGWQPDLDLPLDLRVTAFQWRVYEELRSIPYGSTRSYGEIAGAVGLPNGARAVGHACATNPVALIVPCHRAIRKNKGLGGYRWGLERKKKLLARESGALPEPNKVDSA